MTLEEALYTHLSGYAGLTALVSTRIYPDEMPQGCAKPAVVYQRIDTPREYTHDGPAHLAHPRFQFTAWALPSATASGSTTAKAVADQIRAALDGYTGTMGGAGGVAVQAVFVADERSGFEMDGQTRLHSYQLDVILWHEE